MKSAMDFSFEKRGKRPLLILANHQTSGKGRHNNRWKDEKNKSVLVAIVEKSASINKMPIKLLSHLFALQVCLALKKITSSQEIKIKWPNDIMLSGKKIAGILIERKKGATLLGLGINVYKNKTANSAYLMKKDRDLSIVIGKRVSSKDIKSRRQIILLGIMNAWHKVKEEIESGLLESRMHYYDKLWKENSFLLGKKVFMSLKDFVAIGIVKESSLGGDIILESNNKKVSISENDYVPGSCVIK